MFKLHRLTWLLALVVYAAWAAFMPHGGCSYDVDCWSQWAAWIFDHGLGQAYGSGANYLPGHLYEMKLLTLLFDSKDAVVAHIYYLKYFNLLFDIGGALLVASLVTDVKRQAGVLLAILLNIAYLHNTIIWAQFDSVFSTILFASFLAAYREKILAASLLFLVALNFKLQAIILLPPLALLMIQRAHELSIRKIMTGATLLFAAQAIIFLPFLLQSQVRRAMATVVGLSAESGYISLNASTLWQWLIDGGSLRWMSDRIEYHGTPLKQWGLFMVAFSYTVILFPMVKSAFLRIAGKPFRQASLDLILPVLALCVLAFFYFNTQMHERYSFPAFLPLAAYAAVTGRWWPYVIFSIAYLLNNESSLQYFRSVNYQSVFFDYRFSSALYCFLFALLLLMEFFAAGKKQLMPLQNLNAGTGSPHHP